MALCATTLQLSVWLSLASLERALAVDSSNTKSQFQPIQHFSCLLAWQTVQHCYSCCWSLLVFSSWICWCETNPLLLLLLPLQMLAVPQIVVVSTRWRVLERRLQCWRRTIYRRASSCIHLFLTDSKTHTHTQSHRITNVAARCWSSLSAPPAHNRIEKGREALRACATVRWMNR